MRPRPARLDRLPQQYFTVLLARVAEAAAAPGEPLIDLGRGNPEVGPPAHVIQRLAAVAREDRAHGYPPFRGLPELREAIAERYRRDPPPANFRAIVSPLVSWIWIGGGIVLLGALIAAWPSPEARLRRVRSLYAARLGRDLQAETSS